MEPKRLVKMSKYLSNHLRHQPERLGLTLEPGGWVGVDELLAACTRDQFPITLEQLREVVVNNDKQRFAFDAAERRIRANQGQSVEVDLQLPAVAPPAMLYHGTGRHNIEAIRAKGLLKMARHHVHLSLDVFTAMAVGRRHGKPVVFVVDSQAMAEAGSSFYRTANGVWLTEHVPAEYLRLDGDEL